MTKIMRMENGMEFSARQPKQQKCKDGKEFLLLTNERLEKRTSESVDGQEATSADVYIYDGVWVNVESTNGDLLAAVKSGKVAEIEAYDASSAVNGFTLNGSLVWLDKATRVGLMNSTNIAKASGSATTTLWLGGARMVVPCDKAIQLLSALEMYALGCFNVTASHKAAVEAMTTIDEVLAYDYTQGYPEQLKMEV